MEQYLFTLGGKVRCVRCNATSKRTRQQCGAPALRGKAKCRIHGGRSSGPKTQMGRERCAKVKTIHGDETRKKRIKRKEVFFLLRMLDE